MIPRSSKPLKRTPLKKRNPKRRASEFKRCYGSKQRVEFVKSLPCSACGVVGYSENAHLLGNGGMSRKGPYTEIGPLCCSRIYAIGCHTLFDAHSLGFLKRYPDFDPEKVARKTEEMWQANLAYPREQETQ